MIGSFLHQLRWELRRLWRRPRTYVAFGACLLFEGVLSALYRLPAVREQLAQHVWRVRHPIDLGQVFSGPSSAVEVMGDTMVYVGALFLALVAADILGKEFEDGTLRMVFCRPVSRTSVLLQKVIACVAYTVVLTVFIGATALALGLVLEGPGRLVMVVPREGILGSLDFWPGLERYAFAVPLGAAGLVTITLLAFTLSCFPMKPGTATTVALSLMLADWVIHLHPAFVSVSPYCVTTRIASWRQLFNDDVPWLRMERNYAYLLCIDGALLALAWWAFHRRPLTAR